MKDYLRQLSAFKELDFSDKGEAFVEQKFVSPLLECLGYDTDDDYEVKRHGDADCSFKLSYPPVEHGAKKVKHYNPDYIPTIRKRMFWIIEAKSPSVQHPFEKKYLVQGLQYCIHPEIQACYLVMTNGLWTSIYDAQRSVFFEGDMYEPIYEFKNTEIEHNWKTIHLLLSAEKIRFILENRLKEYYNKLSLTSLNEYYPEKLINKIEEDKFKIRDKIKRNLAERYVKEHNKKILQRNNRLDNLPDDAIDIYMDHPISGWGKKASEVFLERKLKLTTPQKVFDECVETYESSSIFRKEHYFILLSNLHNLSKDDNLKEKIKEFILSKVFQKLNLLNYVEAQGVRVFRKIILMNRYEPLKNEILLYIDELPEIIKFGRKPRPIDFTYPIELLHHDKFFSEIRKMTEEELSKLRVYLEALEEKLDPSFIAAKDKIPHDDMELSGLEWTGAHGFIPSLKNIVCNKGLFEYSYLDELSNKHIDDGRGDSPRLRPTYSQPRPSC